MRRLAGADRIVREPEQRPYLIETEAQLARAANEAEALQVGQTVTTVTGNRATRRWEEADALVIAYGLDVGRWRPETACRS